MSIIEDKTLIEACGLCRKKVEPRDELSTLSLQNNEVGVHTPCKIIYEEFHTGRASVVDRSKFPKDAIKPYVSPTPVQYMGEESTSASADSYYDISPILRPPPQLVSAITQYSFDFNSRNRLITVRIDENVVFHLHHLIVNFLEPYSITVDYQVEEDLWITIAQFNTSNMEFHEQLSIGYGIYLKGSDIRFKLKRIWEDDVDVASQAPYNIGNITILEYLISYIMPLWIILIYYKRILILGFLVLVNILRL